jgi:hypothetical protein
VHGGANGPDITEGLQVCQDQHFPRQALRGEGRHANAKQTQWWGKLDRAGAPRCDPTGSIPVANTESLESDLTFKREEPGPAQGAQSKQVLVWMELHRSGEEREEREGEHLSLHHVGADGRNRWFYYNRPSTDRGNTI